MNKETEIMKRKQIEFLELRSMIAEMKKQTTTTKKNYRISTADLIRQQKESDTHRTL